MQWLVTIYFHFFRPGFHPSHFFICVDAGIFGVEGGAYPAYVFQRLGPASNGLIFLLVGIRILYKMFGGRTRINI